MYYRCIVADPPWSYDAPLKMRDGVARSAASQYATLSVDRIKTFLADTPSTAVREQGIAGSPFPVTRETLPLSELILPDAHLWLWVTNPFLLDGTGAAVCRAWGFEPKALVTWTKGRLDVSIDRRGDGGIDGIPIVSPEIVEHVGMGSYTRGVTEHLIFAARGKAAALVQDKSITNWFLAPRGAHSEKPDEAYARIERVSPGPRLDIFARKFRQGWDAVGDQLPNPEQQIVETVKAAARAAFGLEESNDRP